MTDSKRYYWLKLNEDFFEQEEIKIIENMKNGKDYIIFYLKLLLKSINTDGKLLFRGVIPYTPEMLSAITNTDIDTIRVAINLFTKLNLMEIWDDGTLFLSETQNMIGSEAASTERVRRFRAKKEAEEKQYVPMIENHVNKTKYGNNYYIVMKRDGYKCQICGSTEKLCVHHIDGYTKEDEENNQIERLITLCKSCQSKVCEGRETIPIGILEKIGYPISVTLPSVTCNTNSVTCNKKNVSEIVTCNTEIEIDIDKEIDKEIEIEEKEEEPPVPYEEIKELYNSICLSLSKVRSLSSIRKKHLKARWRQLGFNIKTFEEAFKKLEASSFCTGENDRGWKADFDWLIKNDNNIIKVLEGKYDNDDGGGPTGSDAARYFKQNKDKFLA